MFSLNKLVTEKRKQTVENRASDTEVFQVT